MGVFDRLARTGVGSPQTTATEDPLGYAASLTPQAASEIVNDPRFLADAIEYYRERDGATFSNAQEVIDYFFSDRTWRNMNTISMGRDLADAYNMPDNQATRLGRLQRVYDAYPSIFDERGRGWQGLAQNLGATLLDPINAIGFGVGGVAARGAGAAVGALAREAGATALTSQIRNRALGAGLRAGVRVGAAGEAAAGALSEGVADTLLQNRDMQLGLQEGFSPLRLATSTAAGAVLSGAAGGVLGGISAVTPRPSISRGLRPSPSVQGAQQGMDVASAAIARREAEAAARAASGSGTEDDEVRASLNEYEAIYARHAQSAAEEQMGTNWEGPPPPEVQEAIDRLSLFRAIRSWPSRRQRLEQELERAMTAGDGEAVNRISQQIETGNASYETLVRAARSRDAAGVDAVLVPEPARITDATASGEARTASGEGFETTVSRDVSPGTPDTPGRPIRRPSSEEGENLRQEFATLKARENENPDATANRLEEIRARLRDLGEEVPDEATPEPAAPTPLDPVAPETTARAATEEGAAPAATVDYDAQANDLTARLKTLNGQIGQAARKAKANPEDAAAQTNLEQLRRNKQTLNAELNDVRAKQRDAWEAAQRAAPAAVAEPVTAPAPAREEPFMAEPETAPPPKSEPPPAAAPDPREGLFARPEEPVADSGVSRVSDEDDVVVAEKLSVEDIDKQVASVRTEQQAVDVLFEYVGDKAAIKAHLRDYLNARGLTGKRGPAREQAIKDFIREELEEARAIVELERVFAAFPEVTSAYDARFIVGALEHLTDMTNVDARFKERMLNQYRNWVREWAPNVIGAEAAETGLTGSDLLEHIIRRYGDKFVALFDEFEASRPAEPITVLRQAGDVEVKSNIDLQKEFGLTVDEAKEVRILVMAARDTMVAGNPRIHRTTLSRMVDGATEMMVDRVLRRRDGPKPRSGVVEPVTPKPDPTGGEHGRHIGRTINTAGGYGGRITIGYGARGSRTDVGVTAGAIQSVVRPLRGQRQFFGKLVHRMWERQDNGRMVIHTPLETAARMIEDAAIARTSKRWVRDQLKEAKNEPQLRALYDALDEFVTIKEGFPNAARAEERAAAIQKAVETGEMTPADAAKALEDNDVFAKAPERTAAAVTKQIAKLRKLLEKSPESLARVLSALRARSAKLPGLDLSARSGEGGPALVSLPNFIESGRTLQPERITGKTTRVSSVGGAKIAVDEPTLRPQTEAEEVANRGTISIASDQVRIYADADSAANATRNYVREIDDQIAAIRQSFEENFSPAAIRKRWQDEFEAELQANRDAANTIVNRANTQPDRPLLTPDMIAARMDQWRKQNPEPTAKMIREIRLEETARMGKLIQSLERSKASPPDFTQVVKFVPIYTRVRSATGKPTYHMLRGQPGDSAIFNPADGHYYRTMQDVPLPGENKGTLTKSYGSSPSGVDFDPKPFIRDPIQNLIEKLQAWKRNLTLSTAQEAAANAVEAARSLPKRRAHLLVATMRDEMVKLSAIENDTSQAGRAALMRAQIIELRNAINALDPTALDKLRLKVETVEKMEQAAAGTINPETTATAREKELIREEPLTQEEQATAAYAADAFQREAAAKLEFDEEVKALQMALADGEINLQEYTDAIIALRGKVDKAPEPVRDPANEKPEGARVPPYIVVHAGWEIDVHNHFTYTEGAAAGAKNVHFNGQNVGSVTTLADKSVSIRRVSDGATMTFPSSDVAKMNFPLIFADVIDGAMRSGAYKPAHSGSPARAGNYRIEWRDSRTYTGQKTVDASKPTAGAAPTAKAAPAPSRGQATPRDSILNTRMNDPALNTPEGRTPAIQILTGAFAGEVRVASNRDRTIGQMLGKSADQDYVIGHVDGNVKNGSAAAAASFRTNDPNAPSVQPVAQGKRASVGRNNPSRAAGDLDPANKPVPFARMGEVAVVAEDLPGITTLEQLHNRITNLELKGWDELTTPQQMEQHIQALTRLYELRKTVAPHGIRMWNTTRLTSIHRLRKIASRHAAKDIYGLIDILRRIGNDETSMPSFFASKDGFSYNAPVSGSEKTNQIGVQFNTFKADASGMPRIPDTLSFLHEVAHWAYFNILPDDMKLQFWQAMRNYAGRPEAMRARLPHVANNEHVSPAEFFANQMVQWVSSRERAVNMTMWDKFAQVIKEVIHRFVFKWREDDATDLVDPNLVPLFERIMPDVVSREDVFEKAALDTAGQPYGYLVKNLNEVQRLRRPLEEIADIPDTRLNEIDGTAWSEIVAKLDEVAKIFFAKQEPRARKGRNGRFKEAGSKRTRNESFGTREMQLQIKDQFFEFKNSAGFANPGVAEFERLRAFATDMLIAIQAEQRTILWVLNKKLPRDEFGDGIRLALNGEWYTTKETARAHEGKVRAAARLAYQTNAAILETVTNDPKFAGGRVLPLETSTAPISLKDATLPQLRAALAAEEAPSRELIAEIVRRRNAQPDLFIIKSLSGMTTEERAAFKVKSGRINNVVATGKSRAEVENGLMELAHEAVKNNDRMLAILSISRLGDMNFVPKNSRISSALETEVVHSRGVYSDNGIPPGAPPAIKEVLRALTHRDKLTENFTRTLAYRMLSLAGRVGKDAYDNTQFTRVEDVYAIAGRPLPEGETRGAFFDMTGRHQTVFNEARKNLRRFAIGLNGDATAITMMHEIAHVIWRMSGDRIDRENVLRLFREARDGNDMLAKRLTDDATYRSLPEEELAEEWFVQGWAEWLANRNLTAPGQLRGTLSTMFDRLIEMVAYVVNGLMGSKSLRQQYRQLTFYGDMFRSFQSRTPTANAAKAAGVRASPSRLAVVYAREVVESMPAPRAQQAREFVNSKSDENLMSFVFYRGTQNGLHYDRDLNPNASINPAEDGLYGPGIYLSRSDTLAQRFADDEATGSALKHLVDEQVVPGKRAEAHAIVDAIVKAQDEAELIRREMQSYEYRTRGEDSEDLRSIYERKTKEVMFLHQTLAEEYGVKRQPLVVPLFARANKIIDMSANRTYTLGGGEGGTPIAWLIDKMVQRGLVNADEQQSLARTLSPEFDGTDLYEALTGQFGAIVGSRSAATPAEARALFTKFLKEEGYDGIATSDAMDDDLVDGLVIFDANNVKHIEAAEFDETSPQVFRSGGDFGAGGTAVERALVGEPITEADFAAVAADMSRAGYPDVVIRSVRKAMRREAPSADDIKSARKLGVRQYLWENSKRFRRLGAQWFADKIKPENGTGFYEALSSETARVFQPIAKMLHAIGGESSVRRWARRSNLAAAARGKHPSQPAAFNRIVSALRRGPAAIARLDTEERAAAERIARAFEDELAALRAAGVQVGDAKAYGGGYFPQIWDIERLMAAPAEWKAMIADFMVKESRSYGTPIDMKEALKRADNLYNAMIDADGITVHTDGGQLISNHMMTRVLTINPDTHPEMERFLVNDLEAVVARYFDQSVRRRLMVERFGINNHALQAYKATAVNGRRAVIKLLMSDQNVITEGRDLFEKQVGVQRLLMQRVADTEEQANEIFDEMMRTLGPTPDTRRANRDRAFSKLVSLSRAEPGSQMQKNWELRANAILDGIIDFGDKPMDHNTQVLVDMMANALQRKAVNAASDPTGFAAKTSRRLRAFNSVTLLGFTTLTSLPDIALPLVRSGSFKSWAKGWAQYMSDPDYRDAARNIGVAIENIIADRMTDMVGDSSMRFSHAFFNATLLTPWTTMQREVAALIAFEAFKTEQRRAISAMRSGRPSKRAQRFLERYGLSGPNARGYDFAASGAPSLDSVKAWQNDTQIREAITRFVNESIFTPNPNDIPLWAQTPWGQLVFQLKSFPVMMGRLARDVMQEARHGNVAPVGNLLLIASLFGAASLGVKDVVQARGGEDEQSLAFRNRSLSNIAEQFGIDPGMDNEDADALIGWWMEGLLQAGGFGLIADLLYNSAAFVDNGAYGTNRFISLTAGPSAGLLIQGFEVAGGARAGIARAFGSDEGDAEMRAATRNLAGRIPVLGQVRAFREGAADLAGSADDGGGGSPSPLTRQLFATPDAPDLFPDPFRTER